TASGLSRRFRKFANCPEKRDRSAINFDLCSARIAQSFRCKSPHLRAIRARTPGRAPHTTSWSYLGKFPSTPFHKYALVFCVASFDNYGKARLVAARPESSADMRYQPRSSRPGTKIVIVGSFQTRGCSEIEHSHFAAGRLYQQSSLKTVIGPGPGAAYHPLPSGGGKRAIFPNELNLTSEFY